MIFSFHLKIIIALWYFDDWQDNFSLFYASLIVCVRILWNQVDFSHNCKNQCLVKSLQPIKKKKCPFAWRNKFPHTNKVFFPSDLAVLSFGLTLFSSMLHLAYWSTKNFIACILDKNYQKLNISNLSNIYCKNLFVFKQLSYFTPKKRFVSLSNPHSTPRCETLHFGRLPPTSFTEILQGDWSIKSSSNQPGKGSCPHSSFGLWLVGR